MMAQHTNPRLMSVLVASLGLLSGGSGVAQTYTILKSFAPGEGRDVQGGLVITGSTLYGTTYSGGAADYGTLFKLNTDGTGFETLHSFTNLDGINPEAELIVAGNTLYGTAVNGGSMGRGTVYRFNLGSSNFTLLTSFEPAATPSSNPGGNSYAPLVLAGSTLYGEVAYGMAVYGGVFRIETNAQNLVMSYDNNTVFAFTLLNGAQPRGGLLLSGSTLFGTTSSGGSGDLTGGGVVFKVTTNGGLVVLKDFPSYPPGTPPTIQMSPGLALSGTTLFATTTARFHPASPPPINSGTIFKVDTDGTNYGVLKAFSLTDLNPSTETYTNADGATPNGRLVLYGSTLYGTTSGGGLFGRGSVYKINTDGTGFTVLKHFTGAPDDGAQPIGKLVVTGTKLYGSTSAGGTFDRGTVFSLSMPPQLTITGSGEQVVLRWPADAAGYELQFTTNLVSPVNWTPASPSPTIVSDQNVVTNSASELQQYYRLIKQ